MTTRSAFSASRRIAFRTFAASRSAGSALPLTCCLMNDASACSAWARTARVIPGGTRWRTTTWASWRRAIASAKRIASSAWGPPRTGTRIRLISLGAALLDDGDVARRLADDLVDRRREDRGRLAVAAGRRLAAPAEDDQVRLLLGGCLDDALGGVAADPDDGMDRSPLRGEVEDALEEAPGVPSPGRALGQRHPLRHLDDPEGGQLAGPPARAARRRSGSAPRP